MSVQIWPPIAPEQLKVEEDATQARELTWLIDSFQTTLLSLKHGLEECYALLAPIDPGSTLVLSTPRAELVKGHVTRVGSRLVKGTVHTKLRTTAPMTLSINPAHPIHLAPLATLHTLLTEADNLASICLSEGSQKKDYEAAAEFLSSQLRLLAQHIDEASAILRGPPPTPAADKGQQLPLSRPGTATGTGTSTPSPTPTPTPTPNPTPAAIPAAVIIGNDWTQWSAATTSFTPPLGRALSFHVTIQDACLVLHLRALEPADAPVNLGIKLALAIGTARRLEHDEAEKVFSYRCHELDPSGPADGSGSYPTRGTRGGSSASSGDGGTWGAVEKVYVREKIRVESADPSLLSMSTKLTALSNTLGLARRNLAAVMGVEFEG
ncbi:hypothetical protein GGS20DRAFT_579560 [Poronia punctata]|nr:hypothetical protein GGS20DRAFT_579560 [Poronia punctata]